MTAGTRNSFTDTTIQQALAEAAEGVSLRSVTKKYGSVTAIEDMTLDIVAGSYCCLLGPSGCGKTTALRLIAGHEEASNGDIFIGTRRVNDLPPAKRNTAMMFQSYALFPHKTVWENVKFGLKMRKMLESERRTRVGEMLEMVGLSHLAERKPHMLSGGQQQRIALARALVTRPQVLMLDEPLSALDENLRVRMRGELRRIQKQFGMTFIQVTHHVEEAFSLSDQVVVMNHGHIDQIASPTEIFDNPASQFVARFMGDNNIFSGKVMNCAPDTHGHLIQLEVEGIGSLFCRGQATPLGKTAACSVRPDLVRLEPHLANASPQSSPGPNHVSARITAVELTGYVTRVSLMAEATGQELLYKVRTHDWNTSSFQEGQLVTMRWSADDCVFLPY
ncbi:ABC transporter ATP-binding protein [Leptolyngbya sp. FACHB-261]|uniref:ABC transporter ATP-binding protein n=1 Tax=Leptolyngbya sp. FACHB-261 TaxID=2692806 RepID=UPI001681D75C|nr:ABC transporter ATP-binding protein [Leptolyngbya sp. FACHB-261]MBD2099857.1 ABC transporter ATP-binding protein [Leptolyngbya sp. FACHB-261]